MYTGTCHRHEGAWLRQSRCTLGCGEQNEPLLPLSAQRAAGGPTCIGTRRADLGLGDPIHPNRYCWTTGITQQVGTLQEKIRGLDLVATGETGVRHCSRHAMCVYLPPQMQGSRRHPSCRPASRKEGSVPPGA
jgi:hypothetical protein